MSTNQSLLAKADLALSQLTANGGVLEPEQGASFIRTLIKTPTLIRNCRVVEMTSPQRKINKIGFGQRILRVATSATALPANAQVTGGLGGRAAPTTSQIELSTHEQIAQVNLPYDVLEDNIERAIAADNGLPNTGPGGLRQLLIDMIAERAALDLEELGLLASPNYVNGSDPDDQAYLSQLNGWLYDIASTGHIADQANSTITKSTFKSGLKALPPQFQRNKAALRHYVSTNNETEYRDTMADRGTQMGDGAITGNGPLYGYGIPVEIVSLMPETQGILIDPLNLIFGIQRQVSMEFDKDITERVYIIVLTCRVDYQVEQTDGAVIYENIATS